MKSQIKDAAITTLDNDQYYNVKDTDRDISNHSEYKEKFVKKKAKTTKSEKTTNASVPNNNSNNNYNNSNNYNKNDIANDAGMIDDNEKEDQIPDWMLEKDTSKKKNTKADK